MNNIIVLEPSSNLRALGRNALAGKWKIAITAVLIYQICVTLPALILDQLFGKTLAELYGNIYYDNSYGMASDIGKESATARKRYPPCPVSIFFW